MKPLHISDQELIDVQFGIAGPDAAAVEKHLHDCKSCRRRAEELRATLNQIDLAREDTVASNDLIEQTLRRTRGEPERPPVRIIPENITPAALGFPPRRGILDLHRFLLFAAAAAAVVAAVLLIPKFTGQDSAQLTALEGRELAERLHTVLKHERVIAQEEQDASFDVASIPSNKDRDGVLTAGGQFEGKSVAPSKPGTIASLPADKPRGMMASSVVTSPAPQAVPRPAATAADKPEELAKAEARPPSPPSVATARLRDLLATDAAAPRSIQSPAAPAKKEPAGKSEALAPIVGAASAVEPPRVEFTQKTVGFILPMTSGTWMLHQNLRIRASVDADAVRLDVSNHGALPVFFELRPSQGTNVLQRLALDAGASTNILERLKR